MKDTIKIFSETGCLPHDVLWRYRKGTLSPKEKHKVEIHLTDCELCSDALSGMTLMRSDKVISELRKEIGNPRARKKVIRLYDYRLLAAAAASIALLVVLNYLIEPFTDSDKKKIAQLTKPEEKKTEENIISNSAPPSFSESTIPSKQETFPPKNVKTEFSSELQPNAITEEQSNSSTYTAGDKQPKKISEADVTTLPASTKTETTSSGYAVNAEPIADEVIALESKSVVIATQNTTKEKNESSKITYMNNLKVSRTPAMTPTENFDLGNAGVPVPYENKKADEEKTHAKELPFVYSETLRKGLNYYRTKKTVEAIEHFNEILEHFPQDINATFYKGLSYYDAENYFPASELLHNVVIHPDNTFYEEAKFKLAVCYSALNQTGKAKKIFEEVISEKGLYNSKAKDELEKLK